MFQMVKIIPHMNSTVANLQRYGRKWYKFYYFFILFSLSSLFTLFFSVLPFSFSPPLHFFLFSLFLFSLSRSLNKRHTTTGTRTNGGGVTRDMVVKKEKEKRASFMTWTAEDVAHVAKFHWVPCLFAMGLLFFMGVEYTLRMVPSSSEPFDLGFVATRSLHRVLSASPELNTFLAFLNTVWCFFFFFLIYIIIF